MILKEVDTGNEKVIDTLQFLHNKTFGQTASHPNYNEGWWWIIYDGKNPVAFCGMIPTTEDGRLAGYFIRAGVVEKARGKGLQTKLIKVRESKAKKQGIKLIITDTTANPYSSNNLIKAGFLMFNPKKPWGYDSTLYWKKEL
jgi:GNAT superfamily N-acetyltransferase